MASPGAVNLRETVSVVTGGGRGLGRAFAQALAAAGSTIGVIARSTDELAETVHLIEQAGGTARAFAADITDAAAVHAAFGAIKRSLGQIDLLVNNAGVIGPIGPFAETEPEVWWRSLDVNLGGALFATHYVLPDMIARGAGRIINLVTGVAPFAYLSSYCAGKAALTRFSECLAAEVRPHGVAVFSMGPGTVRTAMSEHSLNSPEGRRWLPWFRRIFDDDLDLPPERPAQLVVRLASGRYDALSGLTLNPRDDLDEIVARLDEVGRDNLYTMRLHTLPNPDAARIEAIRSAGAQVISSARPLRVGRCLDAAKEEVFALWTRAAAWAHWFLPPEDAQWIEPPIVEPWVGGRIAIAVRQRDLVYRIDATFIEIAAPDQLTLRWSWGPDFPYGGPGDTEAFVEFHSDGAGTRMVLQQHGFTDRKLYEAHEHGWKRCFDGMERLLAAAKY
ncbi:MAG TPA: SDR family NAD(P)-dependent oxidoreductase [Stellaceae bacterium]|nr:SDR family NAD(P)-dependent oxidoreductase [Stellaceae bacterium]